MTVSTLLNRIFSRNGYNVVIYKGYSISSLNYEVWSGRDNIDSIPIGLIDKEVVDWVINLSSTEAILTIVVS